jgi:potassium efflux system protein
VQSLTRFLKRYSQYSLPAAWITGFLVALLWGVVFVPVNAETIDIAGSTLSTPATPVLIAQKKATTLAESTAPVTLDGRELFEISQTKDFLAKERADEINAKLREAAQSLNPVKIEIRPDLESDLPVLFLNNQQLLTITNRDVAEGISLEEQAQIWQRTLQEAVTRAQAERSSQFIWEASMIAGSLLIFALVVHWFLGHIWRRYFLPTLQQLFPPNESSPPNSPRATEVILNLTLALARIILWLAIFYAITNLFPLTRRWSYRITNRFIESIFVIFSHPVLTLGDNNYSITNLLILVCLLVGLITIVSQLTSLLKSRILQVTGITRGAQEAVAIIIKYTLISIGTLVVLQIWGLDISSLTILVSALGVGIGFGFQDIAKNFGSGLVLLFERPVQVGDFIEVGEYMGTVERIGARSTEIRTLDNISIIVPNSRFLQSEVVNWSHNNPLSRLSLPIGVAYGSDTKAVKQTLLEAAKADERVLSFPPAQVFFKDFGESSLNFNLLVWTRDPSKQFGLKSDLYFRIEELFRQREIQIPFPQRDLHIASGNIPLQISPELEKVLLQLLHKFFQQTMQVDPPRNSYNNESSPPPKDASESD